MTNINELRQRLAFDFTEPINQKNELGKKLRKKRIDETQPHIGGSFKDYSSPDEQMMNTVIDVEAGGYFEGPYEKVKEEIEYVKNPQHKIKPTKPTRMDWRAIITAKQLRQRLARLYES